MLSLIIFIQAVRTKRAKIPWTVDQKICAAVFITILALGLTRLDAVEFSVHKAVTVYVILAGVYLFDARATLIAALCLGLGASLAALNLNYVAVYTLLAAVTMAFKSRNYVYSIVALVFTDIVLGIYFGAYIDYNFYALLSVAAAVCAFMFTPQKISEYFNFSANLLGWNLVSKNTINRNRAGVYTRINCLAAVFNELQNIYRALVTTAVPPGEANALYMF